MTKKMTLDQIIALSLAVGTFVLAWATWKLADTDDRRTALEYRPYLAFEGVSALKGTPGRPGFTPVLHLRNVGRVLIHYRIDVFDGRVNGLVPPHPTLSTAEGIAFPGIATEYQGPGVPGIDVLKDFTGHVHFKITYWSSSRDRTYSMEENFDFEGNDSPPEPWSRWLRTSTPQYT